MDDPHGSLDELVTALFLDVPGWQPPSERPVPVDADAAESLLLQRLRAGPLRASSQMIACMVLAQLGPRPSIAPALRAVVGDALVPLDARSLAVMLLGQVDRAAAGAALASLPDDVRGALDAERLVVEIALQLPAPGLGHQLSGAVKRAQAGRLVPTWERYEAGRRAAGLPGLLAWFPALLDAEFAPLHDRMIAAVVDERGAGAALVAELLWRSAPEGPGRAAFGRLVSALSAPSAAADAAASEHDQGFLLSTADGGAQWTLALAHNGGVSVTLEVRGPAEGGVEVRNVYVLPGRARMQVHVEAAHGVTYAGGVSVGAAAAEIVARAKRLLTHGGALDYNALLALCLLDRRSRRLSPPTPGGDVAPPTALA